MEERKRQQEKSSSVVPPWQKWGPYVSERSWGTVREDYSAHGDVWGYTTHDQASQYAYRWGEEGIGGFCDRYQHLVFSWAFWNEKDPMLKERLFGLSSPEGNHGEDVKEIYYYLDALPTHSYQKMLYKYPQERFPYEKIREESRARTTRDPEYELVDTGIFNENRYFDIEIEYAKASPTDIVIRLEAHNRGDLAAPLYILPQLWFRNQWAWGETRLSEPVIHRGGETKGLVTLVADDRMAPSPSNLLFDYHLGEVYLYGPKEAAKVLFTRNETKREGEMGPFKDGFERALIHKEELPFEQGTKACFVYHFPHIPPKQSVVLELRLSENPLKNPLQDIPNIVKMRRGEADEFYESIHPKNASEEEKRIQRQALSSMLWSKQIYLYDVDLWLRGDNPKAPLPTERASLRNVHWKHLNSMRILSMPDKWEYPWFAAWDHAFQAVSLALVDLDFAKEQLWLLLFDQFQHPNGQIPAYEWEFSDLNPPLQAWAALKLAQIEKKQRGSIDLEFIERCFHKMLINFAWWVNRVDSAGNNLFEGGFLGLDNIAVIDRSFGGGSEQKLEQSDGTGWMAKFCLDLMEIALLLAEKDNVYESMATKFFQHYVYIGHAMKRRDNEEFSLWSADDNFFYDVVKSPGFFQRLKVRSLVGIIPLFAAHVLDEKRIAKFPEFQKNFQWFMANRKDLVQSCVIQHGEQFVMTLMNKEQLKSVLRYIWNKEEFCSPFGMRSLSKYHEKNPFIFGDKSIGYEPADSLYRIKGGNSNWRGPIWFPANYLLIQSLRQLSRAFGDEIQVERPGEKPASLEEMSRTFSRNLVQLFMPNDALYRPFYGSDFPLRSDVHFRDHLLFHEFFHPETGKGHGSSHQTGWTALIANIIDELYA